jgi:hypothetical protein
MEAGLIYFGLLNFALSGLMLVGAINKYTHASRLLVETKQLALRALARRR